MKYLLVSLVWLTACSSSTLTPTPTPTPSQSAGALPRPSAPASQQAIACVSATVDTANWQTVTETGFSFKLPPDWRKQTIQGVDSLVGRWQTAENRFVFYDYGGFSSTLDEAREMLSDYAECSLMTGSVQARVISGFDATGNWNGGGPKQVVAGAWREIKPGLHLSFTAASDQAQDQALLYAILRSIRFTP